MAIKNRLKEILDDRGIKQKWLADQLGMDKSTMSHLISNKTATTLERAFIIAELLNMKVDDIFYYERD